MRIPSQVMPVRLRAASRGTLKELLLYKKSGAQTSCQDVLHRLRQDGAAAGVRQVPHGQVLQPGVPATHVACAQAGLQGMGGAEGRCRRGGGARLLVGAGLDGRGGRR
jgi:hypothetical protein